MTFPPNSGRASSRPSPTMPGLRKPRKSPPRLPPKKSENPDRKSSLERPRNNHRGRRFTENFHFTKQALVSGPEAFR